MSRLKEILQEVTHDYATQELIDKQLRSNGIGISHPTWLGNLPFIESPEIKSALAGETIVDLGCGDPYHSVDHVADKVKSVGVATYIGVDAALFDLAEKYDISKDVAREELKAEHEPMELILVHADMLDFVSRVKSNSVNICINGIGSSIVPDIDYHIALSKQIARVTKPGGGVLGGGSDSLEFIGDFGFVNDSFNPGVYRKPTS